jgi:acyl-CoA thioesterase I
MTGPVNYVALGDSTGIGVGARDGGYVARLFRRLLKERPGSKLTNHCVSGATTADVIQFQLGPASQSNASLITLGIGINDVGHGVAVEEFAENYGKILSFLRAQLDARIVVINIPDTSLAPSLPAMLRPEIHKAVVYFNQRIDEIASLHGVIVYDVYTPTHELLPANPRYVSADGFHPSDAGYEMWAERMWPSIAAVLNGEM